MTSTESILNLFPEIDIDAIRVKYESERERRTIGGESRRAYRVARGEFANYAVDPHAPVVDREPVVSHVETLIIGGGVSGISAAVNLRKAGNESIRILEEGGGFGGTWYWNRYPGLHVDIESHVYIPFLEDIGKMPTKRYATGHEVRGLLEQVAENFNLYSDALFHTRAQDIRWENGQWLVSTDRGDSFTATYIISASGGLTTPKLPDIPGIESFEGPIFHSSRWDYSYTGGDEEGAPLSKLADKRVGVIGTGATGVQIVPEVAKYAKHLSVFQRTPSTVSFRGNQNVDETWPGDNSPGWQRRRMDNFLEVISGENPDTDLVQDAWTENWRMLRRHNTGAYVSEYSGEARELYEEYLDARTMNSIRDRVAEIVEDPATAELLKPWYRFACKRPTFTDHYLPTFNRANVSLVDTADFGGPSRISETSVWVGEEEYPIDFLVVATGFDVGLTAVLSGAITLTGRHGRTIQEVWAEGPRLFHGYMTHEFPNFFHLGPIMSPNAVNFSHILQLHGEHVVELITAAKKKGVAYIEPSREAEDTWMRHLMSTVMPDSKNIIAFKASCTPGFYNGEGKYAGVSPTYAPGPIRFQELLADWRENHMEEVFHSAEELSPLIV